MMEDLKYLIRLWGLLFSVIFAFFAGAYAISYDKHIAQITCLELEVGKDKCNQIFGVEK